MFFSILFRKTTFLFYFLLYKAEKLSLKINEYSLNLNDAEQLKMDLQIKERNLEDYWKKVKEILHRIELLEKEHDEVGTFIQNMVNLSKSLKRKLFPQEFREK